MSRAFIKEDANIHPEAPPERRASGLPNYVTPAGLAGLRKKVEELSALRRTLAAQKPEDPLDRQRLSLAERDLRYYESRLKTAVLIDNSGCGGGEVRFGAEVAVRNGAGKARNFTIVGEDEADAPSGKISWASPLASALLGARLGASVSWKRAAVEEKLEIVSVRYPKASDAAA